MALQLIDNLGISPLAGLCTYEEAGRLGYTVEQTVARLRRYNYVKKRLNEIFAAHLARTPEWEVKCAFSLHLWLEAEHGAGLRKRVTEMREPPHYLDEAPDEKVQAFFEELLRSVNTIELLVGIYQVVKRAMVQELEGHLAQANPLIDHPTCRLLRFMLQEEKEMLAWGEQAVAALVQTPEEGQTARAWEEHLSGFLAAAGGISGEQAIVPLTVSSRSDGSLYVMDSVPQRDQRFHDHMNQSALIDEYYKDESLDYDERVCALLYKRLREMDVPEWMAPIIYKTRGKPWEYYQEMSRQLWDEARHAMMGEVGLYMKGVPFYRYPLDLKSSLSLNTQFEPIEAHVILWAIEQSLMPGGTGKRWEWEIATASKDELVALFQDYDWADEVLHAQIGRKWLVPEYGTRAALIAASEVFMERWGRSMASYIEQSQQQEWWADLMADVRSHRV